MATMTPRSWRSTADGAKAMVKETDKEEIDKEEEAKVEAKVAAKVAATGL